MEVEAAWLEELRRVVEEARRREEELRRLRGEVSFLARLVASDAFRVLGCRRIAVAGVVARLRWVDGYVVIERLPWDPLLLEEARARLAKALEAARLLEEAERLKRVGLLGDGVDQGLEELRLVLEQVCVDEARG